MLDQIPTLMRPGMNESFPDILLAKLKSVLSLPLWPQDSGGLAIHEFAQTLEDAREPAEVQVALLRRVHQLSGATCVQLWDEDHRHPRVIAGWPESVSDQSAPMTQDHDTSDWLRIPIRLEGKVQRTLRLKAKPTKAWSQRLIQNLSTLATIAIAVERSLRNKPIPYVDKTDNIISGIHNNAFLEAILNYTIHQAQRRHEAVSLLYIGIDRLEAIERLHGEGFASQAIRVVAATILTNLRSSDIIGRLEDDRLVAVLPNASPTDSLNVAEALRKAISEDGQPNANLPGLTVSIGVATYPNHAHDVSTLRAAAASALTKAQSQGRNRVVAITAINPMSMLSLVTAAG